MKSQLLAVTLILTSAAVASAASLSATPVSGPSRQYALYVRSEGTVFDVFWLRLIPGPNVTFARIVSGFNMGVPRGPNEPFTYRNRVLDQDPLDGGKGWGFPGPTINANSISVAGGPLPAVPINTVNEPGGRLFLANFFVNVAQPTPSYVDVELELISNGVTVQTLFGRASVIPEAASSTLAMFAACALTSWRRLGRARRAQSP